MASSKEVNYKELKDELDDIMLKIQDEELDIDVALQLYKRGLELIKQLEDYIKSAENKVSELHAKFDINKA